MEILARVVRPMAVVTGRPLPDAESKNVKPAASTVQDDIPPVHVLEAAENQERKETEDLLAGFDRPGRGPKPAAKERDFVDYYAKKPSGRARGAGRGARRRARCRCARVRSGGGGRAGARSRAMCRR